jgi:hypothetical protein
MKWLNSTPILLLNVVAAVCTITGTAGGIFVGRGNDWGRWVAGILGFVLVGSIVALNLIIMRFRRPCPVCEGKGTVVIGSNNLRQNVLDICPKCNGDGLIF